MQGIAIHYVFSKSIVRLTTQGAPAIHPHGHAFGKIWDRQPYRALSAGLKVCNVSGTEIPY
jgi:hypothetical protein